MAAQAPFLVADQLTRAYGTTIALDHVDLAARQGSVLALDMPAHRAFRAENRGWWLPADAVAP